MKTTFELHTDWHERDCAIVSLGALNWRRRHYNYGDNLLTDICGGWYWQILPWPRHSTTTYCCWNRTSGRVVHIPMYPAEAAVWVLCVWLLNKALFENTDHYAFTSSSKVFSTYGNAYNWTMKKTLILTSLFYSWERAKLFINGAVAMHIIDYIDYIDYIVINYSNI